MVALYDGVLLIGGWVFYESTIVAPAIAYETVGVAVIMVVIGGCAL
jgi:hypothetical protein